MFLSAMSETGEDAAAGITIRRFMTWRLSASFAWPPCSWLLEEQNLMTLSILQARRRQIVLTYLLAITLMMAGTLVVQAQNLGGQPALDKAVQGQTAAQPEGAFLNLVNWVGNVIAPVGAALCVVMAVVSYTHGRGVARWAIAAGGLLAVSGLTRLIEFWINSGTGGVQ